jgi:hypothetical protein
MRHASVSFCLRQVLAWLRANDRVFVFALWTALAAAACTRVTWHVVGSK